MIVVAIIAIIAAVLFVVLKPMEQYRKGQNSQRWSDVRAIVDALQVYQVDNMSLPSGVDSTLRMMGTATSGCDVLCGPGAGGGGNQTSIVDDSSAEFNAGTYTDTRFLTDKVVLAASKTTGTYTSSVKDAGSVKSWNFIQWAQTLPPFTRDFISYSTTQPLNYYSLNTYSMRMWYSTGFTYDQITVSAVLDCDGTCSGPIKVRIGKTSAFQEFTLVDASQVRTDGTTTNYTFYTGTFNINRAFLGSSFYVQLLHYTGTGTIRFMMDEQGPTNTKPQFRTGTDGDGTDTGWTVDNGDYFIKATIVNNSATTLKFQVRSGNTNPIATDFIGPDGTTGSYYTNNNGENLNVADGQYLQYKAYFTTYNASVSPGMSSVTVADSDTGGSGSVYTATSCIDIGSQVGKYLPRLPIDPKKGSVERTYYAVKREASGALKVVNCAPESTEKIELIR